ncbi:MAG: DUF1569 domain-containing protein [Leadbetterella sp.]
MALPNIFSETVSSQLISRLNTLNNTTAPQWGKMNAAQMLAHVNVPFEYAFENKHKAPNFFFKFMLKTFVKSGVVSEAPYKKNSGTAPDFIIKGDRDFDLEKNRLITYVKKMGSDDAKNYEGREYLPFGNMSATEWNNLFYKHIDHHLTQFGV